MVVLPISGGNITVNTRNNYSHRKAMNGSEVPSEWPPAEEKARNIARAKVLRQQAGKDGLAFRAYLPPSLADWMLGLVERGAFADPSEAVFILLDQCRELEPHGDLRRELLERTLQAAIDDPRPSIPAEDVFEKLRKELTAPRQPAVWE